MYQAGTIRRAGDDSGIYEVEAMRRDAETVIQKTIEDVLPMKAVREVLEEIALTKPVYVIAIGKAAWGMADEAARLLGSRIVEGIVVTKYGHSKGNIEGFQIMETAHPFPDDNSMLAAGKVLELADRVTENEEVLLLLSGGGSALVEMPAAGLTLPEVTRVTEILLKCGANIVEINTVRKHLSAIKGGKLAKHLQPATGYAIILSDVVGNHNGANGLSVSWPLTRKTSFWGPVNVQPEKEASKIPLCKFCMGMVICELWLFPIETVTEASSFAFILKRISPLSESLTAVQGCMKTGWPCPSVL